MPTAYIYDEEPRCASRFTGKERDTETGLDYFGARYYASNMGRFTSPDPLMASAKVWEPQTWNRYAYVSNNPLKMIDPTGMAEVTAAQCAQDSHCVTVNVNVIYDKNSNDGKGLTDKQRSAFEKGQLQNAKDQYGNADIHLNVTYTAGALSIDNGKASFTGLHADALNVVVTDQVGAPGSGMAGKYAFSLINANSTDKENLPHEMSHHFYGDPRGVSGWIMNHIGFLAVFPNTYSDIANDIDRAVMRTFDHHPFITDFNKGAVQFQRALQPTTTPK